MKNGSVPPPPLEAPQFVYFGPKIRFCGWEYKVDTFIWNYTLISKNCKKEGTHGGENLTTLLVKYFNDLLGDQTCERTGMKLHSSMLGTFFV